MKKIKALLSEMYKGIELDPTDPTDLRNYPLREVANLI
jgi:hypothetical protein